MCPADGTCKVTLHEGSYEETAPATPYHSCSVAATPHTWEPTPSNWCGMAWQPAHAHTHARPGYAVLESTSLTDRCINQHNSLLTAWMGHSTRQPPRGPWGGAQGLLLEPTFSEGGRPLAAPAPPLGSVSSRLETPEGLLNRLLIKKVGYSFTS
jgi:hypothetical protein